jgi:hypothetical protein
MAKVRYREGDWFAVPLSEGTYAVGLVARLNPKGVLLGYFFGPRRSEVPSLSKVAGLKPADAVLVQKFGHLGLTQGKWPVLGQSDGWDRADWPMPVFIRHEQITGRTLRVFYDDNDPNNFLGEEQIPPGLSEQGPRDGLMGAGYAEKILTKILS